MVKGIMEGKPEGRRGVGRPCSRWRDAVQEDVKKLKMQNWWTVARDREVWRRILREAVTRPGNNFRKTKPSLLLDSIRRPPFFKFVVIAL